MTELSDPLAAFIDAACVPLDSGHASGTLETASEILATHPHIASTSVHAAAILGDDAAVTRFLHIDPANTTTKGGPRGWDALTHLCFSRYLRLDRARYDGFVVRRRRCSKRRTREHRLVRHAFAKAPAVTTLDTTPSRLR